MKDLKLPKEAVQIFNEYEAAEQCRDVSVTRVFGAKRALYYARIAVEKRVEFWRIANSLYPDLYHKYIYDVEKECLVYKEESDDE